jgi:hypothetical protein
MMGLVADLFFSTMEEKKEQCLDWRIRPSDEQFDAQKERWNDLADVLLEGLKERSGYGMRSWLQGSYKFGTQVRPAASGQEFDIDLGVYFQWQGKPTEGDWTPVQLMKFVQEVLVEYADDSSNDAEGVSEPKPRCARIHFNDDFHIDVPAYHLDPGRDARSLATQSGVWEDSDPKAIYTWWKDTTEAAERPRARRIVRYFKMWAALSFKDATAPSSILLTVLAAQAFQTLDLTAFNGDDDLLFAVATAMEIRFSKSFKVANPVNTSEDLNRLTDEESREVLSRLSALVSTASRAQAAKSKTASAEIWAEIFEHFFDIPEEEPQEALMEKAFYAPTLSFSPEVAIRASSKESSRIWVGTNKIGPIPRNLSLEFSLANADELPLGAIVSWTVRNRGKAAEQENDLGHRSGEGVIVVENSAYPGTHHVDIAVRVNGAVIGRRRVPVVINSLGLLLRNPRKKPDYVRLNRSKR